MSELASPRAGGGGQVGQKQNGTWAVSTSWGNLLTMIYSSKRFEVNT